MLNQNIQLTSKTILLTGAAGFIGANLAQELLRTVEPVNLIGLDSLNDYYDVSIKEYRLAEIERLAAEKPESRWTFIKGNLADRALIDPAYEESIKEAVTREYLKTFPKLEGRYSVHICESADGVHLHESDHTEAQRERI